MKTVDTLLFAGLLALFGAWYFLFRNDVSGDEQSDGSSGSTETDSMIQKLAQAIYDFEDPQRNAVATKNNNPGNLKPPSGRADFWNGQTGVDSRGFATFASFKAGWDALVGDLSYKAKHHPNWSLQSLFNVWLGGGPNTAPPAAEGNAHNYASFVAGKLGVGISTTLSQIFNG